MVSWVPSAHAQDSLLPLSDTAVLAGELVVTSDNFGPPMDPDTPAFMDLLGGGGSFASSSTLCLVTSDPAEAGLCSLTASGTFSNNLCGTFTMDGTATFTGGGDSGTFGFHIMFTTTIGLMANTSAVNVTSDGEGPDSSIVGVMLVTAPTSQQGLNNFMLHVVLNGDTTDCTSSVTYLASLSFLE
jgi:hypothetical protein